MLRDGVPDPMAQPQDSAARWALRGARHIASVPAAILLLSMVGFGALCREAGLTLGQSMFMTGAVWALPSQVVLIGAITGGASIAAAMVGVALSAVRFVPMVASWVPMVKGDGTTRLRLVLLSHFVAITSWVVAALRLPGLPEAARLPFFAGFAVMLTTLGTVATGLGFGLAGAVPPFAGGLLFFLTPVYFLTSLTASARIVAERLGLVFGLALGPLFRAMELPLDLVWAGLAGGTLAYAGQRFLVRRAVAKL